MPRLKIQRLRADLASTSLATSAVNDLAVLSQQKQRQALCLKLVLGLDGLAYFS